jgi:DNA-binding CsgD family transcriptional regulator
MTTPQIASKLRIEPKTVDVHRRQIAERLNIRGIALLVRWAVREG